MIKRITSIILIMLFLSINMSYAENKESTILTINPMGMFFDIQNFELESAISDRSSMSLYLSRSGFASPKIEGVVSNIVEQRITYRKYFYKPVLRGSFYGINLAYISGDVWNSDTLIDYSYNLSMVVVGSELGYRFIINAMHITPFVLARYTLTNNLLGSKDSSGDVDDDPFSITIGLNFGWLW